MQTITDKPVKFINGWLALGLWLAAACFIGLLSQAYLLNLPFLLRTLYPLFLIIPAIWLLMALSGFTIVRPRQAKVLLHCGQYIGTLKQKGFVYAVSLVRAIRVPLDITNFATGPMTITDCDGNPINIGAVVAWRVADAAQAVFSVDDYQSFVAGHSKMALRRVVAQHCKASSSEPLRADMATHLTAALQKELCLAGIVVENTQIIHG